MSYSTLISDFTKKAALFNRYYSPGCTPVNTSSKLLVLPYKTIHFLDYVGIKEENLYLIIKNWNRNKTHRSAETFIRISKLCGKTIAFSLKLLF